MTKSNNTPIKRPQRDCSLDYKLQVVTAVEKGDMTYTPPKKINGIQGRLPYLLGEENTVRWIGLNHLR